MRDYGKKQNGHEIKNSRRRNNTKPKYNINKHNFLVFYKICEKLNEIQLIKNKMDLNKRKIKNHPRSPTFTRVICRINSPFTGVTSEINSPFIGVTPQINSPLHWRNVPN